VPWVAIGLTDVYSSPSPFPSREIRRRDQIGIEINVEEKRHPASPASARRPEESSGPERDRVRRDAGLPEEPQDHVRGDCRSAETIQRGVRFRARTAKESATEKSDSRGDPKVVNLSAPPLRETTWSLSGRRVRSMHQRL